MLLLIFFLDAAFTNLHFTNEMDKRQEKTWTEVQVALVRNWGGQSCQSFCQFVELEKYKGRSDVTISL